MKEFLRSLADIPHNSAYRDLPPAYDDYHVWGLDCTGFTGLVLAANPNFQAVWGSYGQEGIHVAAIAPSRQVESVYYVDAFLRMKTPLLLRHQVLSEGESHFEGSTIEGKYDAHHNTLHTALKKAGRYMVSYTFKLGAVAMPIPPHRYYYSVLHEGRPITIDKMKTLDNTTTVVVKGTEMPRAEHILLEEYGIRVTDVARMFYDAGEKAKYGRFQQARVI